MESDSRTHGLSASAWGAIAALGAAAITGGVTLLTHLLPENGQGAQTVLSASRPAPSTSTPSPGPAVQPSSGVTSEVLRTFVGEWRGPARDANGSGTVTLTVLPTCTYGGACGWLESTIQGCRWDIDLVTIRDGPQLRVATVAIDSGDAAVCGLHPPADDFLLGRDQLIYSTGYSGGVSGLLTRVR